MRHWRRHGRDVYDTNEVHVTFNGDVTNERRTLNPQEDVCGQHIRFVFLHNKNDNFDGPLSKWVKLLKDCQSKLGTSHRQFLDGC